MKKEVTNWSNYPKKNVEYYNWRGKSDELIGTKLIARGNGRCYGDASISETVFSTLQHNLLIDFDKEKGILTCQAGVTLKEILDVFVPKGWFLPVTPGTKFITVGGALASDVHGKNHHVDGCFGDHVLSFTLITGTGEVKECTPNNNTELFNATRGGMGLTGMIDQVSFVMKKIESAFIKQRQIKARNLDEIFSLFEAHKDHTYSMAWIDCLKGGKGFGRSIMMMGEHATLTDLGAKDKQNPLTTGKAKNINMPVNLPSFALNKLSIKAFNWLYYTKNFKSDYENIIHYDGFFYPLDAILHWNRMYGKPGFIQYQFVLPLAESEKGLKDIMNRIRLKGWGSFLAVLKLFGKQESLISFPMEGYTLALDFPIKKGLFEFLDELDKVVESYGGRIYLSKDARMDAKIFRNTYPNVNQFLATIKKFDPNTVYQSDLSQRLSIH